MTNFTPQDWLLLIGGITTLATSIIAALKSTNASTVGQSNQTKLEKLTDKADTIDLNTDGNVTELRTKLHHAQAAQEHMLNIITSLVDQLPEGSLSKAKREVEKLKAEVGLRRQSDFTSDFSQENLDTP